MQFLLLLLLLAAPCAWRSLAADVRQSPRKHAGKRADIALGTTHLRSNGRRVTLLRAVYWRRPTGRNRLLAHGGVTDIHGAHDSAAAGHSPRGTVAHSAIQVTATSLQNSCCGSLSRRQDVLPDGCRIPAYDDPTLHGTRSPLQRWLCSGWPRRNATSWRQVTHLVRLTTPRLQQVSIDASNGSHHHRNRRDRLGHASRTPWPWACFHVGGGG
mmetsp:Transcript_11226/g.26807  ORF Transcript_11226/g.26807 Transcript_11226/m.26807 type:complete len:213 (+) Transcript_11226:297-935(+)